MATLKYKADAKYKHVPRRASPFIAVDVKRNQPKTLFAVLFDSLERQRSCTPLRLPQPDDTVPAS